MKQFFLLLLSFGLLGILTNTAWAECRDTDGDGWYSCDAADEELTSPFARGKEEARCDQVTITHDTDDGDLVIAPDVPSVSGKEVNPGTIEGPNSKVDSNCDGRITGYLPEGKGGNSDIFGLLDRVLVLIGKIAVFISAAALVYGGILFATASGEEMKIQKAKKTIVGAVIGLVIGLIAWNIVGFVTQWFG